LLVRIGTIPPRHFGAHLLEADVVAERDDDTGNPTDWWAVLGSNQ
jgi:hypothetical protein